MVTEAITPFNDKGEPLSPIDAQTGVVLPIIITEGPGFGPWWNKHHAHFEHEDFMNGTPGTRAVCFSNLRYVPKGLHKRYHDKYAGTQLPYDCDEEFRITVLGNAGYVPELGVDLSGSNPEIRYLRPEERAHLQEPGMYRIERKGEYQAEIGRFLMSYAIWQDFGDTKKTRELIDKFLSIDRKQIRKNPELQQEREQLGFWLLSKAIKAAATPIEPTFERAKQNALRIGSPTCARLVVREYVAPKLRDYIDPLEERLQLVAA